MIAKSYDAVPPFSALKFRATTPTRRESLRGGIWQLTIAMHNREDSDMSLPSTPRWPADDTGVPQIDGDECFGDLADKLSW
jgi:hypothetical protein